jgi:hypothetical protein
LSPYTSSMVRKQNKRRESLKGRASVCLETTKRKSKLAECGGGWPTRKFGSVEGHKRRDATDNHQTRAARRNNYILRSASTS